MQIFFCCLTNKRNTTIDTTIATVVVVVLRHTLCHGSLNLTTIGTEKHGRIEWIQVRLAFVVSSYHVTITITVTITTVLGKRCSSIHGAVTGSVHESVGGNRRSRRVHFAVKIKSSR